MKKLDDLGPFWEKLANASSPLLMLDYDGTLAPFREERDQAVPYPGVREHLQTIQDTSRTRLVIISGRYTKHLLPLLGMENHPEIWGSHGRERLLADGTYQNAEIDPAAKEALANLWDWCADKGFLYERERKPASLALHWRGLAREKQQAIQALAEKEWPSYMQGTPLELHHFDGGIELRLPGKNKGDAVRALLKEEPVDAAAYLGDDLTDEDAFKALEGQGICVLVRPELRESRAEYWLRPPKDLFAFLDRWIKTLAKER